MSLPDPLTRLIEELQRLPGIGPKGERSGSPSTSSRPREQTERLVDALRDVRSASPTALRVCNNITDVDPCAFCSNGARDPRTICVEEPQNVTAIEKTREFKGPVSRADGRDLAAAGIGPTTSRSRGCSGVSTKASRGHPRDQSQRRRRSDRDLPRPTAQALGVKVTRIATGVPVGSDLEYADEITMQKSFEGRREV